MTSKSPHLPACKNAAPQSKAKSAPQGFQYFQADEGANMNNIDPDDMASHNQTETIMSDEQVAKRCAEVAEALAANPNDPRYRLCADAWKLQESKLPRWNVRPRINEDNWLKIEAPSFLLQASHCSFDLEVSGPLSRSDNPLECIHARVKSVLREIEHAMFIRKYS